MQKLALSHFKVYYKAKVIKGCSICKEEETTETKRPHKMKQV